jgi:HEAT repeat protein
MAQTHADNDEDRVASSINNLSHTDYNTRYNAAHMLAWLGDRRAVEPLIAALYAEIARQHHRGNGVVGMDVVLSNIVFALIRLGVGDERVADALIAALPEIGWYWRGNIARALAQLNDPRAIPPLLETLKEARVHMEEAKTSGENWGALPQDLCAAIAAFGDTRAVKPLLELLTSANARGRETSAIIAALGELHDRRAVEPLCAQMRHRSTWVRVEAARALGKIGDARAIPALYPALTARSAHLRAATVRALGQIGDVDATESLLPLVHDSRVTVRQAAHWALCRMGDERALETLTILLRQGSAPQRRAAASALGRIGEMSASKALIAAQQDGYPQVRAAARKALARLDRATP